ncbi:MAG TPA: hypothetical protein VIC04_04180 [Terriglobia bacterium]
MQAIETRRESVRKRLQLKLRAELWHYVVPVVIVLTAVFLKNGVWKGLIGTAVVVGLLGTVFLTLLYKERQLSRAPMRGSLKESLGGLLAILNSTARAYLVAYMVLMVAGLGMLAGMAMWKTGVGLFSVLVLAACAAGVVWAYRSGQAYLRQMFGKYRLELMECLKEVEER